MSAELKLHTNAEPSFFNKDALLGGLLGALAIGPLGWVGVAITGAAVAIGAVLGKNRMEHEKREGKTVGEASFWSKDTVIGGLLGHFAGGIAGTAAFLGIAGTAVLTAGTAPIITGAILAGAGVAVASWAGGVALGAYMGGKTGEKRQAKEYEEAKRQTIVNHLSATVSPEVGKAVEYSMEHNKEWGKEVAEDRLLAAAQAPTR